MIKGELNKLNEITQNNQCSEHKKPLAVAWHATENCYAIHCPEGHFPDTVTRLLTLNQELKQGLREDEVKAIKIRKEHEAKEKGGTTAPTAVTFPGVPATDLGTGALVPVEMVRALGKYATKYGLDPWRGHVVLMYGLPYITIDGYLYHANNTNRDYKLGSRPLTDDERRTYQVPEGAHAWVSELIVDHGARSFIGLGIVTDEEMTEGSRKKPGQLRSPVVAAHPWQLAQKRAEWQALRRGFPIGESEELKDEA